MIDWKKDYLSSWNHPHRQLLVDVVKGYGRNVGSICELGCASAPNLVKFAKEMPGLQLGGADPVPEAIDMAKKVLPGAIFDVRSADNLYFADNSVDVTLTDMTCIYLSPFVIKKALREMKRITRSFVVLCEFYHPSMLMREALRFTSGYHAYDYPKLLEKAGFYDVKVYKIPLGS